MDPDAWDDRAEACKPTLDIATAAGVVALPDDAVNRGVLGDIGICDCSRTTDFEDVVMAGVGDEEAEFKGSVDASEAAVVKDNDPSVVVSWVFDADNINESEEIGIKDFEEVVVVVDGSSGARPVTLRKRGIFWNLHGLQCQHNQVRFHLGVLTYGQLHGFGLAQPR